MRRRRSRRKQALFIGLLFSFGIFATLLAGCTDQRTTVTVMDKVSKNYRVATNIYQRPDQITFLCNTDFYTSEEKQDAVVEEWEQMTGIKLLVEQYHSDNEEDNVRLAMERNPAPDVVYMQADLYRQYAKDRKLFDVSKLYEDSALSDAITASGNDRIIAKYRVNGQLYGIPVTRERAMVTYVRTAWLKELGLSLPTTKKEYEAMLEAFATKAASTAHKPEDSLLEAAGSSSQGEMVTEASMPKTGTPITGSDETMAKPGTIDGFNPDTDESRELDFLNGETGTILDYAGERATYLTEGLRARGDEEGVSVLPYIEGTDTVRVYDPYVIAIPAKAKDPEDAYHYFIETMFDQGQVQTLFMHGANNVHWSVQGENLFGIEYLPGDFHMEENTNSPGTVFRENLFDAESAIVRSQQDPAVAAVSEAEKQSQEVVAAYMKNTRADA